MRYDLRDEVSGAAKYAKWSTVLSSVLMAVFGLILFIWPNTSMTVICNLLGIALIVFGISRLVEYFSNSRYHLAFQFDFGLGLFSLLFGLLFLLHPGTILSIAWILVGIYEIVEGALKFQSSLDAKHFGLSGWWAMLLSAVICIAFGAFLTFNPAKGGAFFIQVMGISLVFVAVENAVFAFYISKRLKNIRRQLHDDWIDPDDIID